VHPNERLLRDEYEARARRDDGSLAAILAEDIVWHVPGRNAISGVYRGWAEVMEYVRRRRDLADDTFELTVHDVLANDNYGLVIATGRVTRSGRVMEWPPMACIDSRTERSPNAGCSQRINCSSTTSGPSSRLRLSSDVVSFLISVVSLRIRSSPVNLPANGLVDREQSRLDGHV
jgi:uncharacterized protein